MPNNDTYTGEILVGQVDFITQQNLTDYELNAKRLTDVISLVVADDRGKRSIIELPLPAGVPGSQFKRDEVWAIPIRTYWSSKSNQIRRAVRKDMPPFRWSDNHTA